VWCTATGKPGPTAQGVSCVTNDPANANPKLAQLESPAGMPGAGMTVSDAPVIAMPASYEKFTSQIDLGHYLMGQYHIRTANELASCEVCHR